MGKYCIAANCKNNSKDKKVSFHIFPSKENEPEKLKKWVQQVQRTRDDWKGPTSQFTYICGDHFTPDCYDERPELMEREGLQMKRRNVLKPDALPTIFRRNSEYKPEKKKMRLAFQKREHKRNLQAAVQEMQSQDMNNTHDVEASQDHIAESTTTLAIDTGNQTEDKYFAKPNMKQKKIQASVKVGKHKKCQTDCFKICNKGVQVGEGLIDLDNSFVSSVSTRSNHTHSDPDYNPEKDIEVEAGNETIDNNFYIEHTIPSVEATTSNILKEPKFIVFWSALQTLFAWIHCPSCHSSEVLVSRTSCESMAGTLLRMQIYCEACGKITNWKSQPYINNYPAGNVLLSSAILMSGSICSKAILLFKHMGLWCIDKATFYRHQKELLYPAIKKVWQKQQNTLIGLLRARGEDIIIGGDGRADSMGHCAKYGAYTTMELKWNCIIDLQVVASSEVGGSYHMELEGLKRSLSFLYEWLNISTIVTDRHRQISKWLQENYCNIRHKYDIWHVAKGVGKKLEAAAKLKECEYIRPWIQSIVNHLYWAAISTPPGQGDMIVAKWISVVNHVCNIHSHNNNLFSKCAHGSLAGREMLKKWLTPGTKSAVQLEHVCLNKILVHDIYKLSGDKQTWNLEAFHSLINQFAPKMFYFGPIGMECRLKIAALHYNENAGRCQHITKEGKPSFQIRFPKYKKGGYIVRKLPKNQTHEYVTTLWDQIIIECSTPVTARLEQASQINNPPTLCQNFTHPDKEEAIIQHNSRYKSLS